MGEPLLYGGGAWMNMQSFVPREFDIFGGLDVDKKIDRGHVYESSRNSAILQPAAPSRTFVELCEQALCGQEDRLCL